MGSAPATSRSGHAATCATGSWATGRPRATGRPTRSSACGCRSATTRRSTKVLEGPIPPPHDLSHGYHPNDGGWAAALRAAPRSAASIPSPPWSSSIRTCPSRCAWRRSRRWCRSTRTNRASRARCSPGRSAIERTEAGSGHARGLAHQSHRRPRLRRVRQPRGGRPGRQPQRRSATRRACGACSCPVTSIAPDDLLAGDLTLATTHPDVTVAARLAARRLVRLPAGVLG